MNNVYLYILIMCAVTFVIRVLPMTLIRRKITNTFIRSFLYYIPYVTLAVMTFPAIMNATQSPVAGIVAMVIGIALAFMGAKLFLVTVACCVSVFIIEFIMFPPQFITNLLFG